MSDSTGGTGQATGSGDRADSEGKPGAPASQAASTGGIGSMDSQQAQGAPPANAPYTLNPTGGDDDAKSDSGT